MKQSPPSVRYDGEEVSPASNISSSIIGPHQSVSEKGRQAGACPTLTQFALESDVTRKHARQGLVRKNKDGEEEVDAEAIKAFVDKAYKGWYKPNPLQEYKNDPKTKRRIIEYGKESVEGPWECPGC